MEKVQCHNLKIESVYFEAVRSGDKTFEIRFNDRDYKKGDFVVLHEFNVDASKAQGETIEKRIGFITEYEQQDGYVVFSLMDLV